MTVEQHKAIARRWSEELWSRGDLAVADEIVARDYLRHDLWATRDDLGTLRQLGHLPALERPH